MRLIRILKDEIKSNLVLGNATSLPWEDKYFDLVISINTSHNLHCYELEEARKRNRKSCQK